MHVSRSSILLHNLLNIILMEIFCIGYSSICLISHFCECFFFQSVSTILWESSPVNHLLITFPLLLSIHFSQLQYIIVLYYSVAAFPGTKRRRPHSLDLKEPLLGYSAVFVNEGPTPMDVCLSRTQAQ